MDSGYVVEAARLTRRFGRVEAVHNLSFCVEKGSIYGLLGKNGAGKTTAMRLLLGLQWPDAGQSWVFGEDSRYLSPSCRQRIGYVSESGLFTLDHNLSLSAHVQLCASMCPWWNLDYTNHLLQRFAVPTDRALAHMSWGERRQCELVLALAQKPDLLILDEPMLGLDVTVRRKFLGAALGVTRDEGKAVLLTSHLLSDVERVVDTIGILDRGELLLQASLEDLKIRTKLLVFSLSGNGMIAPPVVDGELARTHKRKEMFIVTGAYTEILDAQLRHTAGLVDILDMNLEEIFLAWVEHQTGVISEEWV